MTGRLLLAIAVFGCQPASLRSAGPSRTETVAAAARDPAAHVAANLVPVVALQGGPTLRYAVDERMAHFRVSSVSIAVADHGQIAWARAFGATPRTLFQAASISKAVSATATLRLVDGGKLSLDEDVNHYLKSWRLPDSELTAIEKVTLRRILSHTAGLSGPSVCNYHDSAAVPTLPQVLDGKWPHAEAIVVRAVPGSVERYSGGGVTIEQLLVTDVTQKPFSELLDELVLGPAGMTDSSFAEPLPPPLRARAAQGHDSAGHALATHRCPEVAAAGLWTTPSDLLRWALAVAKSRDGNGGLLSKALAVDMLTAQKAQGHFGLGPFLEGSGRAFHFGHQGWSDGFHAEVVFFPDRGQGAAVMVDGDGGRPMVREILYAVAAEYGWPGFAPVAVEALPTDAEALDRVVGTYDSDGSGLPAVSAAVRREGARLLLDAPLLGVETEVVLTSKTALVALDTGDELSMVVSDDSHVSALKLGILVMARRPDHPTR